MATVRRVVTGHDAAGNPVFTSDGAPPHQIDIPDGPAVADLWSFAAAPLDPDAGFEPDGGFPIEPPVAGMWWRYIRLPLPDQSLPREEQFLHAGDDPLFTSARRGMHATATLDFAVILDGEIELETEDGCVRLGAGDCVVQRGTQHRWRVVGDGPCTYAVALFALDPAASASAGEPAADLVPRRRADASVGPRRIVTGVDADGRSIIESDGAAYNSDRFGESGSAYADLWQTGGALGAADQGGDVAEVQFTLDPIGRGIAWKYIEIPPFDGDGDAPSAMLHRTDTVDLDLILDGDVELELPDHGSVHLRPGDVVVQRGTWHKWHNRGERPMRMLAIMVSTPLGGRSA
jgi:mannose-6-phosphate isomerase-like protein (cupin superfamily)